MPICFIAFDSADAEVVVFVVAGDDLGLVSRVDACSAAAIRPSVRGGINIGS
jgi:hypothetical protein